VHELTLATSLVELANSHAAQQLIKSPINVSTLGWIRESASQRTMWSIAQPKVIPIKRV